MKRFLKFLWLLAAFVIVIPFFLIAANGSELEEWEVILVGLVVIAVAQVIRWIIQLIGKKKLDKRWAYITSLIVSFVLAWLLRTPAFPAWLGWDKVFEWLTAVFQSVQGVIFWATLIYNIVLTDLLDKLGDIIEKKIGLKVRGI